MKIRVRRGKVVENPTKWAGSYGLTTQKTIRDRKAAARGVKIARRIRLMKESAYHFSTQLED